MADDKTKKGSEDRTRINLSERYEILYWREKFGVSESDLEAAVAKVGSMAIDVENYLKNHHR
jgi:hypothetical protein